MKDDYLNWISNGISCIIGDVRISVRYIPVTFYEYDWYYYEPGRYREEKKNVCQKISSKRLSINA